MNALLAQVPWAFIGVGYVGLLIYLLTSLADPSDESLSSVKQVFTKHARTVLTAAIVTPVLVMAAKQYNELNTLSAFCAGYLNISVIRKAVEGWQARAKMLTGGS